LGAALPNASSGARTLKTALGVVAVAVAVAYPLVMSNSYFRYVGVLTLMFAALATSWNIMGGFTGYVSLGHSAFFGLGAYLTALAVLDAGANGFDAAVVGGLIVGLLAIAIGYVALRVRGASFVIVTIALVYITNLIAQGWRSVTGGSQGLTVPPPVALDRSVRHLLFYYCFLAFLGLALLLWWYIGRSKFGMGLKAVREDEDKAESLGVPTTGFKVAAFSISAGMTAIGGGLYALWFGNMDPIFVFAIIIGTNMVLMSLLGGIRYLFGPLVGALIITPSTEYFLATFGATQIHLVASGVLLAIVVLVMPDGIIPTVSRFAARRRPPAASIREQSPVALDASARSEVTP